MFDDRDQALVELGRLLHTAGYRFTTITPESHRRVNQRPENAVARNVRDVFGWSRPFAPDVLPPAILDLLGRSGMLIDDGALLRSAVRFSTAGEMLFVHSAFPTTASDAVFFGPDTYRYLNLLERLAPRARRVVDIGCGTGAGGLQIAAACDEVILADVNDEALRLARINAAINGIAHVRTISSDVLAGLEGDVDLVISNPPYLSDDHARVYRDGGGDFGEWLSVEIVRQSLERLRPGGRLILYTATTIVDGIDTLHERLAPLLAGSRVRVDYRELDPDVFGEELERAAYRAAERIAVVGLDVSLI